MEIKIDYLFVKRLPENKDIKENTMYIVDKNAICIHLCFCGCNKIVLETTDTPNKDLNYDFNSKSISFGNKFFNKRLECQSLYSIKNNIVYITKQ